MAFLMYLGFRVVLLLLSQVGCGDGGTRVMYHPKNSHNGALLAATRAPKKYAETTTGWWQQRRGGGGGGGVAHLGCAVCLCCLCMRQALGCGPCQPEHWHSAHSSCTAHVQDRPPPPACVCAQGSGALPHPRTAASEWAGQQDGLRGPPGKEQELCAVCAPKQDRQRVSMYV